MHVAAGLHEEDAGSRGEDRLAKDRSPLPREPAVSDRARLDVSAPVVKAVTGWIATATAPALDRASGRRRCTARSPSCCVGCVTGWTCAPWRCTRESASPPATGTCTKALTSSPATPPI